MEPPKPIASIKQEPREPMDNFDEDGQQGFGDEEDDDAGKSKWDTSSDSELEIMLKTKSGNKKIEQNASRGMSRTFFFRVTSSGADRVSLKAQHLTFQSVSLLLILPIFLPQIYCATCD